mgnify:CR=1 FL=1
MVAQNALSSSFMVVLWYFELIDGGNRNRSLELRHRKIIPLDILDFFNFGGALGEVFHGVGCATCQHAQHESRPAR